MRATDFEFRQRFWVIGAIFAIGFQMYFIDHQNAAVRLVVWLRPDLANDESAGRLTVKAVFFAGAAIAVLAALLRSWATAYLRTEVVHDARLHSDHLVADGPYRRVRNPLYLGLIMLAVGGAPMASGLGAIWIVIGNTVFALRLIAREESELSAQLGESYRKYCAVVPRLVPALTPRVTSAGTTPQWTRAILGEAFIWMFAITMIVFAATLDMRIAGAMFVGSIVMYLIVSPILLRRIPPSPSPSWIECTRIIRDAKTDLHTMVVMPDRVDVLSLTSDEFVREAALRGVNRAAALAAYRRAFRENQLEWPWTCMSEFPVARTSQEHDTIKFVLKHADRLETESVILPITGSSGRVRNTLCVSSQVGCAMGCTFCETAQMGLMKNLTAAQIISQWHAAVFGMMERSAIDNIVFMGMGEPMENLDAVVQSIRILTDRNGPAIPPARIAVSTVGRSAGILRLAEFARQSGFHKLRLAVSINAPNDAIRSQIMPINRATPMTELMEAMQQWPTSEKSRVLIEYVLIPGVNDEIEHARELCVYLRPLRCTVNVISYNPRRNSPWPAPTEVNVKRFVQQVHACGQFVKRRQTLGRSVMAACGQLGNPTIRGRRVATVGG